MNPTDDIGPDLTIRPGQIGEILIESLIEDASGTGYTATVRGGGVLSLRLSPEGQRARRNRWAEPWSEARLAAVQAVLDSWACATGPAFAHDLRHHAAALGVPFGEIKAACFLNPARTPPPLREAHERAQQRRRDTFNASRDRRRRTP